MSEPSRPPSQLIERRHLTAGGRRVLVELFHNERGSVAARFLIGANDTPIVDGPTKEAALVLLESALDALALTRSWSSR